MVPHDHLYAVATTSKLQGVHGADEPRRGGLRAIVYLDLSVGCRGRSCPVEMSTALHACRPTANLQSIRPGEVAIKLAKEALA